MAKAKQAQSTPPKRTSTSSSAQLPDSCGCGTCGCGTCAPQSQNRTPSPSTSPAPSKRQPKRRRIRGPQPQLWSIARRARQLLDLTRRCTFYERVEVLDREGRVLQRHQRGYPFVFRRGLGVVPIDLEYPVLDDGTTVSVTTTGHMDDQGRWHRVIRYQRLPGQASAATSERTETVEPLSRSAQEQVLKVLLKDQRSMLPVSILIRDKHPAHRLPPRAMTGLAFTEHHRSDTLTPRRRKLRAENHERRVREAGPLRSWIRSVGGKLGLHATLYGSILSAWIPRAHVKALLARPEVVKVEARATSTQNEDTLTSMYLCGGSERRWNSDRDRNSGNCKGSRDSVTGTYTPEDAYLDAANAATGTLDYVNAGYDGMIGGGLSTWGHRPLFTHDEMPTLTYGIRDLHHLEVTHPAFLWNSYSRFLFTIFNLETEPDVIHIYNETQIADGRAPHPLSTSSKEAHATRCAAVAVAKPYTSSDPELATEEARNARSGVARRVAGLSATGTDVLVYEMLYYINSGTLGLSDDGEVREGIDVISSSSKEGHGELIPEGAWDSDDLRCPSDDDTRGLDFSSMAIVYAFYNDSVVFAKAGGNDHIVSDDCTNPYEISAPGASPAAISSSALGTSDMTAAEIQGVATLLYDTNRETTPDGRSYPLIASVAQSCGCASSQDADSGLAFGYGHHGHTSATAPRIAGTALLFKHWDLEQHGSVANSAGRTIVNVLHFADGYARDDDSYRVAPPSPGWGLGRLRMRLYPDAQTDGTPFWGTTNKILSTGSFEMIDISKGRHSHDAGLSRQGW